MELDLGSVGRPVRQLKKTLKGLAGGPSAQEVHDLRTRSRRVEAIAGMVTGGSERSRHNLRKTLKPLRKAAGAVRDMDVLASKARMLGVRDGSVELLLAHLLGRRVESARILIDAVEKRRKDVRVGLNKFSHEIEKHVERGRAKVGGRKAHTKTATKLMDELSGWPAFDAENLHAFRIKVKKLRYVLQLTGAAEARFLAALDKVKARIGDWHDWQELRAIAGEVLGDAKRRKALEEIEQMEAKKLKLALAAARAVKTKFLGPHRGGVLGEV